MRKKLLILTTAFLVAISTYGNFTTRTIFAQCGCSCAIQCGGRCGSRCSGCEFFEGMVKAAECCEGAREATGPVEDCPASGVES